ncbi:MAG: putative outer membrane protein, partial [Candidatus Levybacteria bacterium GW2011_GWB1_35_5]
MASASANLGSNAGNGGAFVFSHGIQTKNGSYDVAEDYPTRDDSLEPGDLVAIDTKERGFVKRSSVALDAGVIGVYSEKPALRLTQDDVAIDGGRAIPVALAGRVPVKVSTENGKIKSGDYLTASSVPGVAMKATKTGNVVGQAMGGYDEQGIGRILVYVRSNSYSGTTASLFERIDITSLNFEQEILTKLLDQKQDGLVSEINTDRIIAGLEIITPKIVADELIVKKIKAEQIEGLEIITGKISSIDSNIASLSAIFNSSKPVVEVVDQVNKEVIAPQALILTSLNVDGVATISADLRVKGSGLVEGIFNIVDTLVTNNLIANGISNFFADVIFKGNVLFESVPTFNNDTGGFAVVKKDSDRVEVAF